MPLITVTVSTPHQKVLDKAAIAAEVSRLSTTILGKDPGVTAIIVTRVPSDDWFCGGKSLTEAWLASFWLDIHITDGTNTKDEKAAFIAAAYESMAQLLGPLHEESYVHVHDVRGDAYGFGGLTQERRYIARQIAAPVAVAA
ncbi:MAG TPA: 4-oxalocrotonate tautomerase family protein [Pseudolabrys sp.]|jgi:4-oxalocrotonate tautomerase